MVLFRDSTIAITPNITDSLLATVSDRSLTPMIAAEDLLAYVYALGGTAAFS